MNRATWDRLWLSGWLFAVWTLLWGSFTPAVLLSGLIVAPLCLAACRLPALATGARPHWGHVLHAVGRFAVDTVRSSAEVGAAVLHRGRRARSAIIALPVPGASDLTLATIANRISLIPGTLVVDVDRPADTLYVFVFDVRNEDDIEAARRDVERTVNEVLRAVGNPRSGHDRRDGVR